MKQSLEKCNLPPEALPSAAWHLVMPLFTSAVEVGVLQLVYAPGVVLKVASYVSVLGLVPTVG